MVAFFAPAAVAGRSYLAPLAVPATPPVELPPDGSTPAPAPTAADIYETTIMRMTTIYLQAPLGPTAINLTVSLT